MTNFEAPSQTAQQKGQGALVFSLFKISSTVLKSPTDITAQNYINLKYHQTHKFHREGSIGDKTASTSVGNG
jgi:hypothetical protein